MIGTSDAVLRRCGLSGPPAATALARVCRAALARDLRLVSRIDYDRL